MTNHSVAVLSPRLSLGLLILRIGVGALFAAHGAQKFFEFTIAGTAASFAEIGVPLPHLVAPVVAIVELVGGILLVVGFLTRPVAILLAIDMAAAVAIVHAPLGLWVNDGGFEFVGVLAISSITLAFTGAGAYALDRALLASRAPGWLAAS